MTKTFDIMGYKVLIDSLEALKLNERQIINTINPHSYIIAKNDFLFQKALKNSNFLIPDGSGIVLAANQIYKKSIEKIAGADLHMFLLKKMNQQSGKVFYMGASKHTLDNIKKRIALEYPNIIVESYSPPFKAEFSEEDNNIIISKINNFNPNVLFIGMTAPKQEKWLYENKEKLNFVIAASIGAVFDFFSGTVARPSQFWIKMHLEWLIRFLKEPKRLWKRNLVSTPMFLFDVILHKLK